MAGVPDGAPTQLVSPSAMNVSIPKPLRRGSAAFVVFAALVLTFGVCEWLGWPFLGAPMQRALGAALQRKVSFSAEASSGPQVKIRLLGGIRIDAAHIEIGAPDWSRAPHLLLARDAHLTLAYIDIWRASRGQPLRIRELRAAQLDTQLERLADGRASWQFGTRTNVPDTTQQPTKVPMFGRLQVDAGTLQFHDALMGVDLDGKYSWVDGANVSGTGAGPSGTVDGLVFSAKGNYHQLPLRIDLRTTGVLPVIAEETQVLALPVNLDVRIGGASVVFNGTATDALHLGALQGRFVVQGPSLAAVGGPVHVTLPTTGPFRAEGVIAKNGVVWNTVVDAAAIGTSRLSGAFTYDPRPAVPLFAGRLTGAKLALADLGPAVGAPAKKTVAVPEVSTEISAERAQAKDAWRAGRVLPDRKFDLPALRAMDANVLIDIDNLDLGTSYLEPLKPLRAHLVLIDGVLALRELDARTGQGRLFGTVQLDGRKPLALWTADLRWSGVRLENWIRQQRAGGAPPYVSGNLGGEARVAGQGTSTATILGSLRGAVRMQLSGGTISHLAVEAAGLDIAQGLGMLIKGDDSLALNCSVADWALERGLLKPRVFVLDTPDSTLWIDGSVSLADESLDLRVVTTPKDFSPLALRTPIRLRGSFASPRVSLDKGPLGARLGASALLAFINPLAAIIPLMDVGSTEDAKRGADACQSLSRKIAARPALPAPEPAKTSRPSRR